MSDFTQPTPQQKDIPTTPTQVQEFTPEPLPEPPILPFTMKADLKEYRNRIGIWRIALALILMSFIYLRFGYIAGIISTVAIVATLLVIFIIVSKRSITLREDVIEYRNAFGSTKTLRYEDISTVKAFLAYVEPTFGYAPRVIIGKKTGGPFVSLVMLYWNVEDTDLLLATLESKKVKNESYTEPAVSAMVAKQFPEYVKVHERHPYWVAWGIVVAIVVAVIIFVLLTM